MGRKRKIDEDDDQYDPPSSHLSISHIVKQDKRLIIILEGAQLESIKVRTQHIVNVSRSAVFFCFFFLTCYHNSRMGRRIIL